MSESPFETELIAELDGLTNKADVSTFLSTLDADGELPYPARTYCLSLNLSKKTAKSVLVASGATLLDLFIDLVNGQDAAIAIQLGARIIRIWTEVIGPIKNKTWEQILVAIRDPANSQGSEYTQTLENSSPSSELIALIHMFRDSKNKPSWLAIYPRTAKPKHATVVHFNLPEPLAAGERIADHLVQKKLIDKSKYQLVGNDIMNKYAVGTLEERINILAPILDEFALPEMTVSVEEDINLFTWFGPVNSHPTLSQLGREWGESLVKDSTLKWDPNISECERYGGCRMLLCDEFSDSRHADPYDESIEATDWFRPCHCGKKIEARHHALRLPRIKGGWVGCYCSKECAKIDIEPMIDAYNYSEEDSIQAKALTAHLFGRILAQLDNYGIRENRE